MPAPNHPLPPLETLANGLRVSLRHAPHLKRCAATLRVAAGSHDVPLAWPGLAHFLEHLLFLGTERFPVEQGLMAYVRAQGGQLNARTCERATEFFFELPASAFAGGLERLCEMLAQPRMSLEDQHREREVLHAEFIAWSRDATAQRQFALFDGLHAAHPLRAFHAGNRYSLNLPNNAFQQALQQFHREYYQAGQMVLSLAGPQPLEELRALAERYGSCLPSGQHLEQTAPPALMATGNQTYQQLSGQRLDLLFALERLPAGATAAVDFLCTWLQSAKPGGLLAELQQRQLAHSLKATLLYEFAGQALLHLEFDLTSVAASAPVQVRELLTEWLGFFSAQADWAPLREEYALLQQRQIEVASALELSRRDSRQAADGLDESGLAALKQVLKQLQPQAVEHFSHDWRLPPANPFLRSTIEAPRAGLIRGQTSAHRGLRTFAQDRSRGRKESSALSFSQALPADPSGSALTLRWQLASPAPMGLHARLLRSLATLRDDARQAGVELNFTFCGKDWLLKLHGLPSPMPAVLLQALKALGRPAESFWQEQASVNAEAPLLPIRQLLKAFSEQPQPDSPAQPDPEALQALWASARWDGLGLALPAAIQEALSRTLQQMPGTADATLCWPVPAGTGQQWQNLPGSAGEHALLLFYPVPSASLADEAAWRLLGQLCQTPFYQRLRVELQLGYGVFSAVRQRNGRTGLLFGVQSPGATVTEILQHIAQFLEHLPEQLQALDEPSWNDQRQALAQQLQPATLPQEQAMELLWQAKLAGHSSDYLPQLQGCIEALTPTIVTQAARQLREAAGGCSALSNRPCSGAPWQVAE
ncbi:pyrroloquinoline quinone biosynthesis protein PqqF [Pseudomonas protegens]|uniref:pyrroloquinoline quinone biosynthesis protein PqqF n=1 Tax=Pseudomonas protegens TaxID=380021 RepID=UPI001B313704|nr:pyrroloquinoline quinone biosynthesis protein PqqF [Pseudomonas protegens]MBP5097841.1 pyrroloquinoline quinone biosynthesis protein PqqF [Pseudomonas protegens]QTU09422.1 pyrroloquinoline quinone biosynthesis protein PqqF [Pseudomonas protegens]QTU15731.1 pyrroloquinoline quinone biosynthesis protein PqqF [Pseudomonas protegens]QTU36888.1 pyrroloquinoline quinone biosynthesis protein PqqF [Pseudomonas protegens]